MVCKPCKERNHGACLTLYPPFPLNPEPWEPRDEVVPTMCDCQHQDPIPAQTATWPISIATGPLEGWKFLERPTVNIPG
jgi:hypothetical protein